MTDINFLDFPDSFQSEIMQKILRIASRGESLFLYGLPGIGKTLLLQRLAATPNPDLIFNFVNAGTIATLSQEDVNGLIKDLKGALFENPGKNLVVINDHVEALIGSNHYFLHLLKDLRETARDKVSLIFAADSNLLSSGIFDHLDPLKQALAENIEIIPPLSEKDARIFIDKLSGLYKVRVSEAARKQIIKESAGIPRLIKRLTKLFADGKNITEIIKNPSLDLRFKSDLEEIASFLESNPEVSLDLPLAKFASPKQKPGTDQVGKIAFMETLTRQEHALAKLLVENEGKIVDRETMIEAVWKNKQYDINEHALDQMLHRLRKKLESATPKCDLITYRGRGAKLEVS